MRPRRERPAKREPDCGNERPPRGERRGRGRGRR